MNTIVPDDSPAVAEPPRELTAPDLVEAIEDCQYDGAWDDFAVIAEMLAEVDPEAAWRIVMDSLPDLPAKRRISERERKAASLDRFPLPKQVRIWAQIAAPSPPEKWLYFGPPDSARPLAMMESRAWFEWHWRRGGTPGEHRPGIPPWLRAEVIHRDGYVCGICGGAVAKNDVHLDHIHPWSLGGPSTLENLRVTHSLCNIRKGAQV